MPRSKDYEYTSYPLPITSTALQDLDVYRQEWGGMSRGEATRQLVIAWSKARHGDYSALGAMGLALAAPPLEASRPAALVERATTPAEGSATSESRPAPSRRRPAVGNGNAQAVQLDL